MQADDMVQGLTPEVLKAAWPALARDDLSFFAEYCWRDDRGRPIEAAAHHQVWIEALQDDSIKRLLIVAPPEHAKTVWCSQIFPAWCIGRNPQGHVLHVSVTATVAKLNSVAIRDTLELNLDYRRVFPEIRPDHRKGWGEAEWFVRRANPGDKDATFAAAGFDGPIISRRAHLLIVDDPHNEETASSPTYRKRTIRRFRRQAMSRLSPDGRAIVVSTRWHHHDLVGDLIQDRDVSWLVIHAPALGDEQGAFMLVASWDRTLVERFSARLRQLGLEVGEIGPAPEGWGYPEEMSCARVTISRETRALWPGRWPEPALEARQRDVGSLTWHTMYQGKGTPPEGKLWKPAQHFRYYTVEGDYFVLWPPNQPPKKIHKREIIKIIQYADTAATEEQKSDFFANATWGITKDGDALWLDLHHAKYETPKQPSVLVDEYRKWNPDYQVMEAKAAGLAVFQTVTKPPYLLPIRPDKPDRSKEARAAAAVVYYEQGKVYHPKHALWLATAEEELRGFPDEAPHDDIVDTVSGGLKELFLGPAPIRHAPTGIGGDSYWRR